MIDLTTTKTITHKRFNPLTRSYVLCCPRRTLRPWQGQQEPVIKTQGPTYLKDCYLCPGNPRAGGQVNDAYGENGWVFVNDYASLTPKNCSDTTGDSALIKSSSSLLESKLFKAEIVSGICKVLIYSPNHSLSMAEMTVAQIENIISLWIKECQELKKREGMERVEYAVVFENKGAVMGCSNPHPHGQIWASADVPDEPMKEIDSLNAYKTAHCSCLLCDLVILEKEHHTSRIISTASNNTWIALVPYWAIWPFEILVLPTRHIDKIWEINSMEHEGLAEILGNVTRMYDNLFQCSFPYSMGIHQAPLHDDTELMHLHFHFYPPLLRSASVKKFLVGYEMFGQPQRDMTPELAADKLRSLPLDHYKKIN